MKVEMVQVILGLVSIPIMLLNFGGGIVGGIWLAFLGKWGLLGLGIVSMFISSFGISLALAPGLLFVAPAGVALDRGRYIIGGLCLTLANVWTDVVMTAWSVGCFYVVLGYYDRGSIWPYLLWAYGMATGPWTYMAARGGPEEVGSHLSAFGACVGAIVVMGVLLFKDQVTVIDTAIAFGIPMLIVSLFQTVIGFLVMREQRLRTL